MKKIFSKPLYVALVVSAFTACQKKDLTNDSDMTGTRDMNKLSVSPNFNFNTTQNIEFRLIAKDKAGRAIPAKNIAIYDANPLDRNVKANLILKGMINENGVFEGGMAIPTYLKEVYIKPNSAGLLHLFKVPIPANGKIELSLTPSKDAIYAVQKENYNSFGGGRVASTFTYLSNIPRWNAEGKPTYLDADIPVSPAQLATINATLPESVKLYLSRPDLFNEVTYPESFNDLHLNDSVKIYVTFVTEGASFRNVLGYYTYKDGAEPVTPGDIDKKIVIFPNASFTGSGGDLATGNTVYLGKFGGDDNLGFFIQANGYAPNSGATQEVYDGLYTWYGKDSWNNELNGRKRHAVFLKDLINQNFMLGFEDQKRSPVTIGGNTFVPSDEDFNDVVFFVTADPINNTDNPDNPNPTPDPRCESANDEYPDDPVKAYNVYFPYGNGGKNYATLMFEDLWPCKGDFDFNDLVVGFKTKFVATCVAPNVNKIVEMEVKLYVEASGAKYNNSFAFQLPIPTADVQSVTGTRISGIFGYSFLPNGCEAGQSKATIIAFDDVNSVITRQHFFHNTEQAKSYSPVASSDTLTITIKLNSPKTLAQLGFNTNNMNQFPFNPFIIIDGVRGKEVHFKNAKPTDLADASLFQVCDDNTDAGANLYYQTKNGALPYAIYVPEMLYGYNNFKYPIEFAQITSAYTKFALWAVNPGMHADWYLPFPSYRDDTKLYVKP
jgi:LruC domain-containing protein